jgi:hypothetical protein
MLSLIFLALFGLYAFFKVNRAKSVPWMVANVAWLVGMGALSYFMQNLYFAVGVVSAVVSVCVSLFGANKLPLLSNLGTYGKMVVTNVLWWPVGLFEETYVYLSSKL